MRKLILGASGEACQATASERVDARTGAGGLVGPSPKRKRGDESEA